MMIPGGNQDGVAGRQHFGSILPFEFRPAIEQYEDAESAHRSNIPRIRAGVPTNREILVSHGDQKHLRWKY